jgi:hypothetical protein
VRAWGQDREGCWAVDWRQAVPGCCVVGSMLTALAGQHGRPMCGHLPSPDVAYGRGQWVPAAQPLTPSVWAVCMCDSHVAV